MKRALVTGVTGQDGTYLAELLLSKGYDVYGLARNSRSFVTEKENSVLSRVHLISGDLFDQVSLSNAIEISKPDEVYNLAAQSFIPASWQRPTLTSEYNALGVSRLLEAIRMIAPKARFYQASTSEIFGAAAQVPQTEKTPFNPCSPYAVAKLFGHWITVNYRESLGLHASSGILFNHESPRRGLEFVTRKITYHAALIKCGQENELKLGNLDSKRDWGFAGDYTEAMWLMLQQDKADDYVISTGITHSVREFVEEAFSYLDLDWKQYVKSDEKFMRPADSFQLVGDPSKAKRVLGWEPKVDFKGLVRMMVDADLELVKTSRVHSPNA